jgi:hypothetical protein
VRYWLAAAVLSLPFCAATAQDAGKVDNVKQAVEYLQRCWRPPPLSRANSMELTVTLSFTRSGEIIGQPRIRYESPTATDNDRLEYRTAVMEALQRCTPLPFSESMAGAVAGHPFWIQFRGPQSRI